MSSERNQFSAAPSAIGYLYQIRYALLESLRKLPDGTEFAVSIETLDDVVFENDCAPLELLQAKHHLNRAATLTDASPDLWKSLRIWCESFSNGSLPNAACLQLVTTSAAGDGSAAMYLRPGESRDVSRALERLNSVVATSTNQENARAYEAFNVLSEDQKRQLLDSVAVIDASCQIEDMDAELRRVIYYAVEQRFLDPFLQRLEGWWYRRAVRHLCDDNATPILSAELEAERNSLREQFKTDSLPIDDDIMSQSVDASGYQNRVFVRQLQMIQVGNGRILHAIRNYFRAFEQRSRWMREDLLLVGELERYEQSLEEEWNLYFERMCDEVGDEAAEDEMLQAAQTLYDWVETGMHRPIRPGVAEPAIARGSYHIMSDLQRVGWHRQFKERLRAILESSEVAS